MDWHDAAMAFPQLRDKDLQRIVLMAEEREHILILFNRSVQNTQNDSADIAMIALKKLLTQFPTWGEAALLYGICLASEGKIKRALASFEHALSSGLGTEELTYLAQVCYREAGIQYKSSGSRGKTDEEDGKGKRRRTQIKDADLEQRNHMQAPILRRAPRSPGKAKLASERERRDVMMQANSGGDGSDEEFDVSIPKTPAEKLRLTIIIGSSVMGAIALGLLIWFFAIPFFSSLSSGDSSKEKLEYLLNQLQTQQDEPAIRAVLADFAQKFPEAGVSVPPVTTESITPTPVPETVPTTSTTSPEVPPGETTVAPDAQPEAPQGETTLAEGAEGTTTSTTSDSQ